MQSLAVTAVATSRMHTSLSRGRGSGTVLIWRTSGGPYPVQMAALMRSPQPTFHRSCHKRGASLGPDAPLPEWCDTVPSS